MTLKEVKSVLPSSLLSPRGSGRVKKNNFWQFFANFASIDQRAWGSNEKEERGEQQGWKKWRILDKLGSLCLPRVLLPPPPVRGINKPLPGEPNIKLESGGGKSNLDGGRGSLEHMDCRRLTHLCFFFGTMTSSPPCFVYHPSFASYCPAKNVKKEERFNQGLSPRGREKDEGKGE